MDAADLTLTVLGNCGSYAGPGGACSGYLIEVGGTTIWMDAGSGTLANLQRHVSIESVDAIVLSHSHPDHWSDIEGFYVACRYVLGRVGVALYAPEGLSAMMRIGEADEDTFCWHTIVEGEDVEIGPARLRFSRTDHPVETYAARLDFQGRSFGYSADSGPGWSLEALGPGLHLALCEATVLQDQEGSIPHMSARQAGASARAAGVERLLLTHVWPTVDPNAVLEEATAAFGGPTELAAVHKRYTI